MAAEHGSFETVMVDAQPAAACPRALQRVECWVAMVQLQAHVSASQLSSPPPHSHHQNQHNQHSHHNHQHRQHKCLTLPVYTTIPSAVAPNIKLTPPQSGFLHSLYRDLVLANHQGPCWLVFLQLHAIQLFGFQIHPCFAKLDTASAGSWLCQSLLACKWILWPVI